VQSESLVHVSRALTEEVPPEADPEPPQVDAEPPAAVVDPPAACTDPTTEVSTLPLQLVTRAIPTRTWNIETADELALFRIVRAVFILVPRSVAPEPGTILAESSMPKLAHPNDRALGVTHHPGRL